MSNWLSDPNNSNRFKQTYVLGFVDVSGNLIVRNGRMNILGDASFNGNIQANATLTANRNVYVLGDASFNGNVACINDASFSSNVYIGGNVRLRDVVLQRTGIINGNITLTTPLNQIYNITTTSDIRITLPKISTSRLEGSEITFYKSESASNNITLVSDATDGLVTYGTVASTNTFDMQGSKTSVKFVVASNRWVEVGSSAIASSDGSFVNMVLRGNLYTMRDASFGGNITVLNDASFSGNVRIARALRGLADASFAGNLFVLRDASFSSNLTVLRDASFGGNVRVSRLLRGLADASFGGNLFVLNDVSFSSNLTVLKDMNVIGNTWTSDIYGDEKYRDLHSYNFTNAINSSVENIITKNYDAVLSGTGVSVSGGKLNGTLTPHGLKIIPTNTTLRTYFTVSMQVNYSAFNNGDLVTVFAIRNTSDDVISSMSFTPGSNSFTITTNLNNTAVYPEYTFATNNTYSLKYQQYINTANPSNSAYTITIINLTTPDTDTFTGTTTISTDNLTVSEIRCGYSGDPRLSSYSIDDFTFGTCVTDVVNINSILYANRDAIFYGNVTSIRDTSFDRNIRVSGTVRGITDASFGGNLFVLRDTSFGNNITVIQDSSFGGNIRVSGTVRGITDASFGGNLFVLRDASFGGNVIVSRTLRGINDASFGGNLFVLRDASFGSNLFVIRDASFGGNLTVIRDASFGGNVNITNNIVLGNLIINNENLLRGNTTALENMLTTKNTLGSDSIAASYDGRYVYYLDNNNTDGTGNTRSIFKSSNYGETFTLMYNYTYTNAVNVTYILSKIATNQYGNVVAVALNSTNNSFNGYLLFNESSTNPVATLQTPFNSRYTTGIKMNSAGTYIHLTRHEGLQENKGVYVFNSAGTNISNLISSTLNSAALYNVQPLYYTTNNEVFALPAKHTVNSPNSTEIINYVYLYNQNTPSQTVSGQVGYDANPFAGVIQTDISEFQFKFVVGNSTHTGCSANTPDNSVKIGFFISINSPTKILKVVANSDSNQIATSLAATCFTSISPVITIRVICCSDTGQKLYIGTTTGLYYMYDPSPMGSNIANNTISLIPGTTGFNITSITCSKTADYVYFSTNDKKMYRYTSENNVVMEFHPATNNIGIRNPNPRVELDVAGSVKVDNNLFVSSLAATNNQVIHQNKFTFLGNTSLLNKYGLYPDSIATNYDGRYVYYLDSAVLVRANTYTLNATDLYWYATNNPDFRENGAITDEQLQAHWQTWATIESRTYLEPFGGNCYTRVMKSADYGKTFTEAYNLRSAFNTTNMTGNTITKIATNNSGSDIVFQRRQNTIVAETFNYAITYSTNYGSTFNIGWGSGYPGINLSGACLSYNNNSNVILSGYFGTGSAGIVKLNTISSTTNVKVLTPNSHTENKMYGSKSLYYSGDIFGFLHNRIDSVDIPTTLLNFVYYIPSTTTNISFTNIDVNGNLTSESNVSAIRVSGNLSSYGFTVPSSKIQTNLSEPYMNGNKSTGCTANTPDGSVKIAFIISHSSPTKILKIAYDGKSMFDSCITIPGVTITGVCCGDNGQHLYIATTRGMYYILDTSPMTSNIADQKVMLVSGTEYMNITAITCSKTSEYIFFSTAYGSTDNQLYRLFNNIMFEYVGQDSELLIKPYSGNVGIRNTNPQYELDVGGSVNISNTLYVNTLAISSVRAAGTVYGLNDASFGGNLFVLNDSSLSNVRISGNLRAINDASFGGNLVVVNNGLINQNFRIGGDLTVNGSVTATAFNAMSDKRLKSNIQLLPSQWEKIKMLQPSEYTWRDSYVRDYGFVAQQVFEIYPHMRTKFHSPTMDNTTLDEPINIHGEPQYYSLDYSKMTTMLCKGLQEAMDIIEKQQVEIDGLKRKIDAIQDRLGPDV